MAYLCKRSIDWLNPAVVFLMPGSLSALGDLARVFKDMANQVYMREKALKEQVQELQIHLNERTQGAQVDEIVGSEYFKELEKIVKKNRARKKPDQKT